MKKNTLQGKVTPSAYRKTVLMLLTLIPSVVFAQKQEIAPKQNRLKVISYNIWNGFNHGKDKDRKQKAIDWFKAQRPDVVALQELNSYTQEKLLNDAKKWGHNYAEIVKTGGYPTGITSNKPITVKERILEQMHHGVLHCETWGIDFFVVHFSPFSFKKRHEEADIILSKLEKVREDQDEYIVLGDFNALSPFDAQFYNWNKDMLERLKESEKKHAHVRNLINGQLEYGAISKYLSLPLIDVVQKHTTELEERLSIPSQVWEKEPELGRYGSPNRVDYIMASPKLATKCTYARTLNGAQNYYLSDHYPVMAIFDLQR